MKLVRRTAAALTAIALACTLTACTSTESASSDSTAGVVGGNTAPETAFPVTINHAFGTTTIDKRPERIATVGWANEEVPLSYGVAPIGMSKVTWGDEDGDGMSPWVKEKLEEINAPTPVLFDEADGIPFEEIADTNPDVILAAYSGITKEDYETLSKIAPVVAFPKEAWTTTLDEMITMDSQGIGFGDSAPQLEKDLDNQVTDAFAHYPGLTDNTVLFTAWSDGANNSVLEYYTLLDPRAAFLKDVGFGVPKAVQESTEKIFDSRPLEDPDAFSDVDMIVAYGSGDPQKDAALLKEMQANPLYNRIPAIAQGKVLFLGNGSLASSANPSPLSIPWGIDKYAEKLNETAR